MRNADFNQQIVALLPRLRRFALVLARNADAADDLVQSTVARALDKWTQFQPDSRLDRWLFQILRSIWISDRRSAVLRQTELLDDHAETAAGTDGSSVTEGRLMLAEVQARFRTLPLEQQQPLLLVCVEGYSYAEAASLLGIPIGTVMSRLARGRAALMADRAPVISDNVTYLRRRGR
jgi:RNA polymerase sigma-70 factor (ECF subfamily)